MCLPKNACFKAFITDDDFIWGSMFCMKVAKNTAPYSCIGTHIIKGIQ